jgi:hypothetical protein
VTDERESGTAEESQTDLEAAPALVGEAGARLQSGTVLAGRYEIRKVIGRGGMGVVADAGRGRRHQDRPGRIHRRTDLGRAAGARGQAGAADPPSQRLPRLRFGAGRRPGLPDHGADLARLVARRDQFGSDGAASARRSNRRRAGAAAGLAAIHAAGILHRDVTPQNVLRMADGRVVLSDFGLATDSFVGTTSVHGGTIAYMAPELVRGGRACVASDVWALGVVSHEIVFGERPHWRPGAREMSTPVAGRRMSRAERAIFEICDRGSPQCQQHPAGLLATLAATGGGGSLPGPGGARSGARRPPLASPGGVSRQPRSVADRPHRRA